LIQHDEPAVLSALQRITSDLAERKIVLGDLWDIDGKRGYLDDLEREGVLPCAAHALTKNEKPCLEEVAHTEVDACAKPAKRTTLIPQVHTVWRGLDAFTVTRRFGKNCNSILNFPNTQTQSQYCFEYYSNCRLRIISVKILSSL